MVIYLYERSTCGAGTLGEMPWTHCTYMDCISMPPWIKCIFPPLTTHHQAMHHHHPHAPPMHGPACPSTKTRSRSWQPVGIRTIWYCCYFNTNNLTRSVCNRFQGMRSTTVPCQMERKWKLKKSANLVTENMLSKIHKIIKSININIWINFNNFEFFKLFDP